MTTRQSNKKSPVLRLLYAAVLSAACLLCMMPVQAKASVPWKYEYHLRGDEAFQEHSKYIIETGVTAPSGQGQVYYAGPSDDVQGMINSLGPGDTLYLRSGVYKRKIRIYGGVNGREDAYITIAAAPGEDVVAQRARSGSGWSLHVLAVRLFLRPALRV